nr:UDP-N-acetylglucosamine 2-epimerase (non-hydrolyzing) [Emcibacter sp.]
MAPLVKELSRTCEIEHKLCSTGQHREMLDQILSFFDIRADFDLDVMSPNQNLAETHAKTVARMAGPVQDFSPDLILVHGDTLTSFCGALTGYFNKIKVGHVEAGLRTGNIYSPWPEEGNRQLTAVLATDHFAPTDVAKENLLRENVSPDNIYVVGNTVIDSILQVKEKLAGDEGLKQKILAEYTFLNKGRLILVTGHRRENFGQGIKNICLALKQIALNNPDVEIVYPVHLNPNIKTPVLELLEGVRNVHLLKPLDYLDFVYLMMKAHIILTDSGGIQEEAPSLGKPVLLMREHTERPEAVEAGTVRLVGNAVDSIAGGVQHLLDDAAEYTKFTQARNPFGDGTSSRQIVEILKKKYIC